MQVQNWHCTIYVFSGSLLNFENDNRIRKRKFITITNKINVEESEINYLKIRSFRHNIQI